MKAMNPTEGDVEELKGRITAYPGIEADFRETGKTAEKAESGYVPTVLSPGVIEEAAEDEAALEAIFEEFACVNDRLETVEGKLDRILKILRRT